jgi:hypothetical protein
MGRLLALGCVGAISLALAGSAPSADAIPAGQIVVVPVAPSFGGGLAVQILSSGRAAPARVVTYVPAGFGVDTSTAPGTSIGEAVLVFTTVSTPDYSDFAFGTFKAGDPASLPGNPAAQACSPGPHAAVWIATLKLDDRSLVVPFYVDPTSGSETSLGSFKLVACLPSPYVPADQGGAPDGLRVLNLEVGLDKSVVTRPPAGTYTWRLFTTPYVFGTATPDVGATFEARARFMLPHLITERLRFQRKTRTVLVTGRVRVLGKPEGGLVLLLAGGTPKAKVLKFYGRVKTRADGTFSIRKHVSQGRRPWKLRMYAFAASEIRGPCIAASTAPGGCVDENRSPPQEAKADVTIPKR